MICYPPPLDFFVAAFDDDLPLSLLPDDMTSSAEIEDSRRCGAIQCNSYSGWMFDAAK